MKVYVVVVNHRPANAPQNYKTECQIFLDKMMEWFEDGTVSNGDIIQRCGLALFILGSCSYYPEIFSKGARDYTNTKLRTLPEGTTIML